MRRRVIDVSELPKVAYGARDPLWWAVMLLVAIEGSMLVLLAVSYFYVRSRTEPFPPVMVPRAIATIALLEVALWIASALIWIGVVGLFALSDLHDQEPLELAGWALAPPTCSLAIVPDHLQQIAPPSAEAEQMTAQRIAVQHFLHLQRQ